MGKRLDLSEIKKRVEEGSMHTCEYISGYKNRDSIIKLRCKKHNHEFEIKFSNIGKLPIHPHYICPICKEENNIHSRQLKDLTGQIFGDWKVIKQVDNKGKKVFWLCECVHCGKQKEIQSYQLQTKTCAQCCTIKQTTTYNPNSNNKLVCEICGKEFSIKNANTTNRKYCYECSPEGTHAERISALRQAMKKQAVKIKGGKCQKCGYDKCIDALQFHHVDPTIKEFGLSNGDLKSWDRYKEELDKCILLCANCHAEEHYNLRQK